MQVEAEQPSQREVSVAHAREGAMDAAVQRQDQADSVLGDRIGRVGGDAGDRNPKLRRSSEIYVVEAGRAERNEMRAAVGEALEHGSIEPVVHEDADGGISGGQRNGGAIQRGLEVDELVTELDVGRVEELSNVGLGTEDGDSQAATPSLFSQTDSCAGFSPPRPVFTRRDGAD